MSVEIEERRGDHVFPVVREADPALGTRVAVDRVGHVVGAPFRRVARRLAVESRVLVQPFVTPARGLRRIPMLGMLGCGLILAAQWVQYHHPSDAELFFAERADLWWPVALFRLPGSMFAPTFHLPLWGALAQVMFVFGLAEGHLGRRVSLIVMAVTHTVATVSARVFLLIGPHGFGHIGLPPATRFQIDTGPSAAVVGTGAYVGVYKHLPLLTVLFIGTMALVTVWRPDLAGHEHLVAIAAGGVFACVVRGIRSVSRQRMMHAA